MIILLQTIVILASVSIVLSVLAGKSSHGARAWKKLALCTLAILMTIAVLFPELTNVIANLVGVGRGADLLLYVLTLAFIGFAINNYLHRQKEQQTLHKLARKIAIYEAKGSKVKR